MSDHQPLAARMRPTSLDQIVGQSHLLFPDRYLVDDGSCVFCGDKNRS